MFRFPVSELLKLQKRNPFAWIVSQGSIILCSLVLSILIQADPYLMRWMPTLGWKSYWVETFPDSVSTNEVLTDKCCVFFAPRWNKQNKIMTSKKLQNESRIVSFNVWNEYVNKSLELEMKWSIFKFFFCPCLLLTWLKDTFCLFKFKIFCFFKVKSERKVVL